MSGQDDLKVLDIVGAFEEWGSGGGKILKILFIVRDGRNFCDMRNI